jgi:predicted nucleic-acid-binding Zn-ribbon protein
VRLDDALAEWFACPKCRNQGAQVKRFAATGAGLSRMFDIEHNVFIAVSCRECGRTEIYNPEILENKENLATILDILFGQ